MSWLTPLPPDGPNRRYALTSPADGRDLGILTCATPADVQATVSRARAAAPAWAERPVADRARLIQRAVALLLKHKDDYQARMAAETGRPALDTLMIEMFASLDAMNYYARNAARTLADRHPGLHLLRMKRARIIQVPLGVVGVISPWNGPFILSLNPSVQALLAGNTVVLKPSEATPDAGRMVQELLHEAGIPDDVFQVVQGDGPTGAALVEAGLDKVVFTGSVSTGRRVGEACARQLIPCTLELGGKDPMLVLHDADLDRAAGGAIFGGMMNSGQFCSGVERVYVDARVAAPFIERVVARARELRPGRDLGPFIHRPQLQIVQRQVEQAIAAGARLLCGGHAIGDVYAATVLTDVPRDCSLMCEETFGPVLPIVTFTDEAQAADLANETEFGLGASIWTRDTARAERLARHLRVGAVTINETALTYGALELPFGGRKSSGVGRSNGADGLLGFTHPMPILTDRFGAREEPVWFPYTPEKMQSLRRALGILWGTPLRWFLS